QHVIVLGDAEYCNETVITWVQKQDWAFVFHTRETNLVRTTDDPAWQPVAEILDTSDLCAGQVRHWEAIDFTQEHRLAGLTLTIQWGVGEKQPICLISNLPGSAQPHLVYECRFWIETLFGNCKSRGFGLARTHLTEPEHIDRLILAIACWPKIASKNSKWCSPGASPCPNRAFGPQLKLQIMPHANSP
ncbi:MAG: transposase, partial [Chloroflexi bacterium]|nr:transposase [Chloroflexota bacterium]